MHSLDLALSHSSKSHRQQSEKCFAATSASREDSPKRTANTNCDRKSKSKHLQGGLRISRSSRHRLLRSGPFQIPFHPNDPRAVDRSTTTSARACGQLCHCSRSHPLRFFARQRQVLNRSSALFDIAFVLSIII